MEAARGSRQHITRRLFAGRETLLDEDMTDEQIEDELSPVAVQLAYAASHLGQAAEAMTTYEVTAHGKHGDVQTL